MSWDAFTRERLNVVDASRTTSKTGRKNDGITREPCNPMIVLAKRLTEQLASVREVSDDRLRLLGHGARRATLKWASGKCSAQDVGQRGRPPSPRPGSCRQTDGAPPADGALTASVSFRGGENDDQPEGGRGEVCCVQQDPGMSSRFHWIPPERSSNHSNHFSTKAIFLNLAQH
jgi:hypothetical protein